MITVCREHVNKGVQLFQTPHVTKTSLSLQCLFCKNPASFEVYYFDIHPTQTMYTMSNETLKANA